MLNCFSAPAGVLTSADPPEPKCGTCSYTAHNDPVNVFPRASRTPAVLSTARLDLGLLTDADVAALIEGTRRPGWAPDFPQPMDFDAALTVFGDGFTDAAPALGYRLLREREGGLVIGSAGFAGRPVAGSVELRFSVVPSRRRRGLAGEAVAALVRAALAAPGIGMVSAYADSGNAASRALLQAAGFRPVPAPAGTAGYELRSGQLPPASRAAEAK